MPLNVPVLDKRRYQDLLADAKARIPVHTPEWTNFNESDPGITILEVFAFLTENLLYVANQIPERNRKKFLTLLGVGLLPATAARGLVQFTNPAGPVQTLPKGMEVLAGNVPFRLDVGLDVLPIEAQVYTKQLITAPSPELVDYYKQLYASFGNPDPGTDLSMYNTIQLDAASGTLDLSQSVDAAAWIALLAPKGVAVEAARASIAGKTLNVGIVPMLEAKPRRLPPGGRVDPGDASPLRFETPLGKSLPDSRLPTYQLRNARYFGDLQSGPVVIEVDLPEAEGLALWDNIEPLDAGTGQLPPALTDADVEDRLITWLKVTGAPKSALELMWVGVNAVHVTQGASVNGELLASGTGAPEQTARLANAPVLQGTVKIYMTDLTDGSRTEWKPIDDLLAAAPEVPVHDPRNPTGVESPGRGSPNVFAVDEESGVIRFGDGAHGARPASGAVIRADYAYAVGKAGNVGAGAISSGPTSLKVSNPIPTWGGADAESVQAGEQQIPRYLQHRDRLVTAEDFDTITRRTPGVDIARVEVLAAYNPELSQSDPGDAPGAVTLMVIPGFDPDHPAAPEPDCHFLDAICDYIDPRRLVTTEVFLRGPEYVDIWISVGIEIFTGFAMADVREGVKAALLAALSPLPQDPSDPDAPPRPHGTENGWPLRTDVNRQELLAIAARVDGILSVNEVQIARTGESAIDLIPMRGLQLPRVVGIAVEVGPATPVTDLRGVTPGPSKKFFPVPVPPEGCN